MYSPFRRIINSIFRSIELAFIHLGRPLLITGIFLIIVLAIMLIRYKKDIKSHLTKDAITKLGKCSIVIIYISFLLEITLFIRIGIPQQNPFEELWTGWNIFRTNKQMYVDFAPIINLLMFVPVAFILRFIFNKKEKLLPISTILAFCGSLIIEFSQAIFHLGTLQISDIVFNTISGAIGFLLLKALKRIYKKKTHCR